MPFAQREICVFGSDGDEILRTSLPEGGYVLGRSEECTLCIDSEHVASVHAHLTLDREGVYIEDLGTQTGTLINGRPVTQITRVWPTQKIQLGAVTVEVRCVRRGTPPGEPGETAAGPARTVSPEMLVGQRKYEIKREVARGGMGAILDARDGPTGRTVAMKVMLDGSEPESLVRFVAEAKITAQLEHPNIVPVHELNVDPEGNAFYTMKFVRGVTLRAVLEKLLANDREAAGEYPLAVLLTIFQKICDAIGFAHSRGVIHRDLKPENVMIGDFGEVLVMDWGIAKVLSTPGQTPELTTDTHRAMRNIRPKNDGAVTMDGLALGTPHYMSPEQARGETEALDERSDIYALGCILYHILTLQMPREGMGAGQILAKAMDGVFVSPAEKQRATHLPCPHLPGGRVPASLDAVCCKAMAPGAGDRYQRVTDLQRDIAAYQTGFATSAENAGLWRQARLLVLRHSAVAIATGVGLFLLACVSLTAAVRIIHARNVAVQERSRAEEERNHARLAQTAAETARDRAQQARTEAEAQRNFARLALAEAETERNRAQDALAVAETERSRAERALQEAETERTRANKESTRAEKAMNTVKNETTRAESAKRDAQLESSRAERALADLKKTAPDIFALARSRLEAGSFDEAIDKIGQAIAIDEKNADYRLFRANLWESTMKLDAAVGEYRRVLTLRPTDAMAQMNLALCEKLLADNGGNSPLRRDLQATLLASLREQQRGKEAGPLAQAVEPFSAATEQNLRTQLADYIKQPGWTDDRITHLPDGTFGINFTGLTVGSLESLASQPVSELNLYGANLSRLQGLEKIPSLRKLIIPDRVYTSIPPGRLNLTSLELKGTGRDSKGYIPEVRRLVKMPLEHLSLDDLTISSTETSTVGLLPLQSLPLTYLSLNGAKLIYDVSWLERCPLVYLDISNTDVMDISHLHSSTKLESLAISNTKVQTLSALSKLHLVNFTAANCKQLHDITPLRRQPLKTIRLDGTPIRDLAPLLECPTLEEIILPDVVLSTLPTNVVKGLKGLPNVKRISFKAGPDDHPDKTAAKFWK